ncbi:hypothetical protein BH11PLA2_BH11PLA2_00220 [soil metagenome]
MPTERASIRQRVAAYGGFTLAAAVLLFLGMRLDKVDLTVPLGYQGDCLLILPLVKTTFERGSHWRNERLGAPGIQELHDFPIVDHFHFGILWLMGQICPDPIVVFNLYHLLTYPLTVLATMIVMRAFGVSFLASGMAGLLFAFLPYHYIRGLGHYFLSAYYTLPLSLWPALAILFGRPVFGSKWNTLGTVFLAAMTASAGAYYAFFTCLTLSFVGVYMALLSRSWRPFIASIAVNALIVLGGIANHAPAFGYQKEFGANTGPTHRAPEQAEYFGMKLPQMLLPAQNHHLRAFGNLRAMYDSIHRPLQNENETATLGLIGSVGFVALMAIIMLPLASRRRQPLDSVTESNQGADGPRSPVAAIAAIVLFLTFYGLIGGLGSLFNFLVTAQVRSINRVSIVIAFFVFFAVAVTLDRVLANRSLRWRAIVFLGLVLFGVWDETPSFWFRRSYISQQPVIDEYRNDAAFFAAIEERIPGGMVFCLPFMSYPESAANGKIDGYDHLRGYLHSRTLRMSFGAMKGREVDQWQQEVSILPVPAMLERLIYRGFDGVMLDTRGDSPDEAQRLLRELTQHTACAVITIHADNAQFFFDLRDDRERLRKSLGNSEFEKRVAAEAKSVRILWLDGFVSYEPTGLEAGHRWCGPSGLAVIVNPTTESRTLHAEMIVRSSEEEPSELTLIGGDVWSEKLSVSNTSPLIARDFVVPPGRHFIRFQCRTPKQHVPSDSRNLSFFIAKFRLTESPGAR